MPIVSLSEIDLKGKRALIRVDFNVPLREDETGRRQVSDDTRIRAAIPTIKKVIDSKGKAILISHLGRPKGAPDPKYSLAPVAEHLEHLLGSPVRFASHLTGAAIKEAIDRMPAGGVILLENTRFYAGETKNDPALSAELAELADVYINDAFGSAHRAHASTEGVARLVPHAVMGFLLEREISYLGRVLDTPDHPFVAVLGGAKVSDKIGVIESLLKKVDYLLIGGAMTYTFLKAQGIAIGKSLYEEDKLEEARKLLREAGERIVLPTDHVVAAEFKNEAAHHIAKGAIDGDFMGMDIGPETVETYRGLLLKARTVVWNGPMGVFEMPNFARGTLAIAQTLADATEKGALTVVGGGDSVAAITQMGFEDRVSHVSTGGGAMLEFLEGITLPGVAALNTKP